MATSVGLNFRLTAAVDKFEAGMRDVEKRLNGIERSSKQTARGMKILATIEVGKLLVGGLTKVFNVISSGVSSVTQFASQAAAAADAIGKLSSMTGMAAEPLQVFTQIAAYGGVSSTQFGDALQKMSRGMGEAANGTGTAKRAIESMGLSVNDLLKMSPSQQFMALGTAIQGIEDPAKRSAAAADIFGRSGTKLIPMFEDLEGNAKATAKEMLELGQVLSGTQVDNIEAMNDSFEKVRKTAFTIGQKVLANFAPAITEANEKLLEFIKNFQFKGEQGGQAFVKFVTEAFTEAAVKLKEWGEWFLIKLQDFLAMMTPVFEKLSKLLADYLGVDRYSSDSANEADQRIRAIEEKLERGARLAEHYQAAINSGLDVFGNNQKNLNALQKEMHLYELQKQDAVKQIANAEESYYQERRKQLFGFSESVAEGEKSASQALNGFFDSLKQVKGADIAAAFGNVKDAAAAVAARLPTFDDAVGATSQALDMLRDPAPLVRDAMNMLGRGFDNTLAKLGISRDSLMKFAEQVTYAQSITGRFAAATGRFGDLIHSALADGGSYIAKGASSAAQALMDILQPLGWTKDAVEAFGAQLNAHKNFKQQLIDNAMSDWDRVAKQRLQYYINQGANPFEAFHAMYAARQQQLQTVTDKFDAAEKAWIKSTGGLTGQMDITAEGVKLATEEITKKLSAAGVAAKEGIEKATGLIKGLFGFGEGADVPSLDLPDPTEELEKQTPILERVARAAEGFGDDFLMATIGY
jgi:hypothetical protein